MKEVNKVAAKEFADRENKLVRLVWDALADNASVDAYGGSEFMRCENVVREFVRTIDFMCNNPTGLSPAEFARRQGR